MGKPGVSVGGKFEIRNSKSEIPHWNGPTLSPVLLAMKPLQIVMAAAAMIGACMNHAAESDTPKKRIGSQTPRAPTSCSTRTTRSTGIRGARRPSPKRRAEDKPIFLSIGYATCHWCHVMEHESFEDPEVAALMNETFINIKVDREERPDIDQVYMTVCQMMTGGGGWPLTIIMTPDKQPFYAATYIPRESRYGRIGMLDLIPRIEQVWESDRDKIRGTTRQIIPRSRRSKVPPTVGTLDPKLIDDAFRQLGGRYDSVNGGFGSAPKFPSPHNLIFLTRYWRLTGNQLALDMVAAHPRDRCVSAVCTTRSASVSTATPPTPIGSYRTSKRCSTTRRCWSMAYTEAWQATGKPVFKSTVREILTYVLRDMTSPEGGFYSAEDADSEGEEGLFYLWTLAEATAIAGAGRRGTSPLQRGTSRLKATMRTRPAANGREATSPTSADSPQRPRLPSGSKPEEYDARLETVP